MPDPLASVRLLDGRVLVLGAGGSVPELYDPATGTFRIVGIATGGDRPAATLLHDGDVLIVTAGLGPSEYAALFHPSTGAFSQSKATFQHAGEQALASLADGRVLIVGGWEGSSAGNPGYLASAEIYDPANDTVTPTGSFKHARESARAVLLHDGRVLVVGGDAGFDAVRQNLPTSVEIYDPSTGKFSVAGSTSSAHFLGTATVLDDGRVLIAGGETATGVLSTAEIYDPRTGKFTMTGSMNTPRVNQTATLLKDGRVLIAGGGSQDAESAGLSTAEIYDPSTGRFSLTGSLPEPFSRPAAALLLDGRVLVTGYVFPGGDSSAVYVP